MVNRDVTILVDMDGVGVAFVDRACQVHGVRFDEDTWPRGEYDIAKVLGLDEESFWREIDRRGVKFWRGLEAYPWFERLHTELTNIGLVYFASTPNHSPSSAAGKILWLQDRFGKEFRDYVLTQDKHLLGRRGCILIDDCNAVVDAFNRRGGCGILFPQVWNSNYGLIQEDRIDYVLDRVFTYLAELNHAA